MSIIVPEPYTSEGGWQGDLFVYGTYEIVHVDQLHTGVLCQLAMYTGKCALFTDQVPVQPPPFQPPPGIPIIPVGGGNPVGSPVCDTPEPSSMFILSFLLILTMIFHKRRLFL